MALNRIKACAIIISASGICDAGRIKHHLRHHLGRKECAIVIIGNQAVGTLGRKLVDDDKHVRIFGEEIEVRAGIHTLGGLSAHADKAALLGWLKGFGAAKPRRQGQASTCRAQRATSGTGCRHARRPRWVTVAQVTLQARR